MHILHQSRSLWESTQSCHSLSLLFHIFGGTTCTGVTHVLLEMAYIISTSRSFSTSFRTPFFITRLSFLCCCATSLKSSSRLMFCMQMDGLIPLWLEIFLPKACLCFFSTSTSLFSSSLHNVLLMMVGFSSSPSRKTY